MRYIYGVFTPSRNRWEKSPWMFHGTEQDARASAKLLAQQTGKIAAIMRKTPGSTSEWVFFAQYEGGKAS